MESITEDSTIDSEPVSDYEDREVIYNVEHDLDETNDRNEMDDVKLSEEEIDKPVLNNNFILPMETEDPQTHAPDVMDKKDLKKSKREKKNGRFYKFVKRHFLQRKSNSNDVKEINILPEGDENKWARRSAGSAASRSSEETVTSEEDRLEVVHDMAEEDILDL